MKNEEFLISKFLVFGSKGEGELGIKFLAEEEEDENIKAEDGEGKENDDGFGEGGKGEADDSSEEQ